MSRESGTVGRTATRTLFVHVGQGKTGSSFLQSVFAGSTEALAAHDIDYPVPPDGHEAARAGRITSGNGALLIAALRAGGLAAMLGRVATPHALFSSEHLSVELLRTATFGKLEDGARAAGFDRIDILLFIRDPVEHASSDYVQRVKRGRMAGTVDEHYATVAFPHNAALVLDAAATCRRLAVTVRNYSRARNHLVSAAAGWLGVDAAIFSSPAATAVNRGLSADELRLVRALNAASDRAGKLVADHLCEQLPDIAGETPFPSHHVQEAMLRRLAPAMNAVDARIDADHRYLRTLHEPTPEPCGPLCLSEAQTAAVAAAVGRGLAWRDRRIAQLSRRLAGPTADIVPGGSTG